MSTKITKKEIKETLITMNPTKIYKLVARLGIDTSQKHLVYEFIKENAHANYVANSAWKVAYESKNLYRRDRLMYHISAPKIPIFDAIRYAKHQKQRGRDNYSKKLFVGNRNIYWASPDYGHDDYNKGVAFENSPRNRRIAELINKYLKF